MTLRELLENWNENDLIHLYSVEHRKLIETTVKRLFRTESPYLNNNVVYSLVQSMYMGEKEDIETFLIITIDISDKKAIQLIKMIDKLCLEEHSCLGCPFYIKEQPTCYMKMSVNSIKKKT